MPTRNVVKVFVPNAYYHVYNRGWNFGNIFIDEKDYVYFEKLLSRHLSDRPQKDSSGRQYEHLYPYLRLNAYCLMRNHFHLLFYQYSDETIITHFMRSFMNAYTAYFNSRHQRRGSLFESKFKAVWVSEDVQLMHITRYIHLNHSKYDAWPHSSYGDYLDNPRSWVDAAPILSLFSSTGAYREFVSDYEEIQRERDSIKSELYGRKT